MTDADAEDYMLDAQAIYDADHPLKQLCDIVDKSVQHKSHVFGRWYDNNNTLHHIPNDWEVPPPTLHLAMEVAKHVLHLPSIDGIVFGTCVRTLREVKHMSSGIVLWYRRGDLSTYQLREHIRSLSPCVNVKHLARYGAWANTSVILFYSFD